MEITQSPLTQPATAATARPEISSDFETFLKMLTVQMQNQDPLNPVDSSDYAVQLATFSGVEQQVQTNDLLRSLVAEMGGSDMAQTANWIGKEALAAVPARFNGEPLMITPQIDPHADHAQIIVRNAAGDEVDRRDVGTGGTPIIWDGVDAHGAAVDWGVYAFDTISTADGQVLSNAPALTYAPVTEVRRGDGGLQIILAGISAVTVEQVVALRSVSGT